MQNNKQHKKPLSFGKEKKGKIYPLYFPAELPKVSHWRRNNVFRKLGGMFGKHLADQYARQERGREADRQGGREGEVERHPEPRGEGSLWGKAYAFQEHCYTSQSALAGTSSSAASCSWLGSVRTGMRDLLVMSRVPLSCHSWF